MSYLADRIARDLCKKTEQAYQLVGRRFANLLRYGEFGDWLTDTSCSSLTPHRFKHCVAFTNPADAMEQVAELYRKALWADADVRFEIWAEEDASDGYAPPIAGLYACRGFNSLTFINDTAEAIYYCGAYQACGAADKIAETLAKLADEPILAQRLAVLPEQIAAWPVWPDDPPCKYRDTVLFTVVPPDDFHDDVRQVIEEHLSFEEFEILKIAKESDREVYLKWDPWEWRPG